MLLDELNEVKDWRYVVRINIDEEDLVKNAATGPDLIDLMSQAIDLIPNINAGKPPSFDGIPVRRSDAILSTETGI